MEMVKLVIMAIIITFIICLMMRYSDYKFEKINKCKNCRYYMSEVETRTEQDNVSLCSKTFKKVTSEDICNKYIE